MKIRQNRPCSVHFFDPERGDRRAVCLAALQILRRRDEEHEPLLAMTRIPMRKCLLHPEMAHLADDQRASAVAGKIDRLLQRAFHAQESLRDQRRMDASRLLHRKAARREFIAFRLIVRNRLDQLRISRQRQEAEAETALTQDIGIGVRVLIEIA